MANFQDAVMELENTAVCSPDAINSLYGQELEDKTKEMELADAVRLLFGYLPVCLDTDPDKVLVRSVNASTGGNFEPLDWDIWNAIWDKADLEVSVRPWARLLIYTDIDIPDDANETVKHKLLELKREAKDKILVVVKFE